MNTKIYSNPVPKVFEAVILPFVNKYVAKFCCNGLDCILLTVEMKMPVSA